MGKKVNLNSVVDLRTAVDTALPDVFKQLGYEESFTLSDIKLGLGLITVAIAGGLYLLEKKISFKDSYYIILAMILAYGLVSAVLYYLTNAAKYKNNKYVGTKGPNEKVSVYTLAKPFDPIYEVKVVFNDNFNGAIKENIPFSKMFDAFGFLNDEATKKVFQELLQKKSQ